MASEEMSFENVDNDGRTTDAWLHYNLTYEPSAQMSYNTTDRSRQEVIVVCFQTATSVRLESMSLD